MRGSDRKPSLTSYDDIFSTEETRQADNHEQIRQVRLSELHPFKEHPFRVMDDDRMMETVESVKEYGVLVPLIVRPMEEGGYEIVSGHRRKRACELAGVDEVPVIVRNLDDDEAVIIMVDANLQRKNILPSERAKAYQMKLEALKHGCLHKALDIAVRIGYIQKNPSSACILPRVTQTEIHPLDTPELITLLESIKGHEYEALIKVAIFTGMRSGELLGLTWDCVDFEHGMIRITRQLVQPRRKGESFRFGTLKNDKPRTLTPAPFVMNVLREHRVEQLDQKKKAGIAWDDGGFPNLVFTYPDGRHLSQPAVWKILQKILIEAGLEAHRFHDLRHTYVVNAFRAGDDVKTVQQNAGHYSAAFTLDRYAHVTETMRLESANRMQRFIEGLG